MVGLQDDLVLDQPRRHPRGDGDGQPILAGMPGCVDRRDVDLNFAGFFSTSNLVGRRPRTVSLTTAVLPVPLRTGTILRVLGRGRDRADHPPGDRQPDLGPLGMIGLDDHLLAERPQRHLRGEVDVDPMPLLDLQLLAVLLRHRLVRDDDPVGRADDVGDLDVGPVGRIEGDPGAVVVAVVGDVEEVDRRLGREEHDRRADHPLGGELQDRVGRVVGVDGRRLAIDAVDLVGVEGQVVRGLLARLEGDRVLAVLEVGDRARAGGRPLDQDQVGLPLVPDDPVLLDLGLLRRQAEVERRVPIDHRQGVRPVGIRGGRIRQVSGRGGARREVLDEDRAGHGDRDDQNRQKDPARHGNASVGTA